MGSHESSLKQGDNSMHPAQDCAQKIHERFYTPCVHGFEQLRVSKV
jgi:hypothetical protein